MSDQKCDCQNILFNYNKTKNVFIRITIFIIIKLHFDAKKSKICKLK